MSPGIEPTAAPQDFCPTIAATATDAVFVAAPGSTDSDARQPAVAVATAATAHHAAASWCSQPDTDTRTIRVLHVVNGEHFAGAERVQSHLGRCLPKYGVRADFACVKPGRFADCVDAAEAKWGVAHRVPMRNRFDLGIARRVAHLARAGEYDLLHAHTPRTALITSIAAKICRLPWVYHVHSPASRDSSKPLVNSINAWIERRSLAKCEQLITVSESLRNDCIESGYHPTRVTVVHNGVPAICYDRPETPKPGGRWVLGMVALMRPRKGLEVAIDAVSLLRQKGHDVVLRCIGPYETDAYRGEIDRRVERLGLGDRIEQVGFQADVPLALSHVDAMLLPSLYGEGLPMVVLEAMAAGLPVVATSVEGTPEAIRDGIDGLLAEPGSASSLAEKIESLVTGKVEWDSLAAESRKRHADAFSDWSMSRGVSQVYNLVLQGDR